MSVSLAMTLRLTLAKIREFELYENSRTSEDTLWIRMAQSFSAKYFGNYIDQFTCVAYRIASSVQRAFEHVAASQIHLLILYRRICLYKYLQDEGSTWSHGLLPESSLKDVISSMKDSGVFNYR